MQYRVFYLGPDQHITGVEGVTCGSDIEALAAAGTVGDHDGGVEVWQAARMVGRLSKSASAALQSMES